LFKDGVVIGYAKDISVKASADLIKEYSMDSLAPASACAKHQRFKEESAVGRHQPFGKTPDYLECISNADPEKMAKLVKLVGMLLQKKLPIRERAN
jgi:hypothetical protein